MIDKAILKRAEIHFTGQVGTGISFFLIVVNDLIRFLKEGLFIRLQRALLSEDAAM